MASDDHDYGSGGGEILNRWARTCGNPNSLKSDSCYSCINRPGHVGPHGDINGDEWKNVIKRLRFQ